MKLETIKIKVSDYLRGRTKWGADPTMVVSFQNLKDGVACFEGYDSVGGVSSRGDNKKMAIENLLHKMRKYDNVKFF